ncbi:MAG: flagellar motor switch protein FliG [Deltaproteobacteria bacterium]|nr:flagellar motor switch protein FliG [Deltaproteobacteria bacterium]
MANAQKLTGPQKAAVFLLTMGEDFTSQIFSKLEDDEIKKLSRAMSRVQELSSDTVTEVLDEFNKSLVSPMGLKIKGDSFVKKIISRSVPRDRAENILEDISADIGPTPFENLKDIDSKTLANFIQNEHPQTIALILAYTEPGKAAEVISNFPENLQTDVVLRIANLENVPQNIVTEVEDVLQKEIHTLGTTDARKVGGAEAVAEILNQVDQSTENTILSRIEEDHTDLANDIRKLMFVFEDLVTVDDRGIRGILREVNNEELTLALKTASDTLKEKIYGNLSERAAAIIKEDLEIMGPVKLVDVEKAQQSVVRVAKKLEDEGKIMLGKGGEETFV